MSEFICQYCGKICKNVRSLSQHERLCKENPNHQESSWIKFNHERCAWNKGLTKETDERVKRNGESLSKTYKSGNKIHPWTGKHHSEETKKKLSLNAGGYRIGSGWGISGWYKGIYCDSSWELAFVIYNLENNIPIKRNKEKFSYIYNGKNRKYLPDFILDKMYIEIKGYVSKQWEAKLTQFPKDKILLVIGKKEIQPYIEYVINKYGKDFIRLYEK